MPLCICCHEAPTHGIGKYCKQCLMSEIGYDLRDLFDDRSYVNRITIDEEDEDYPNKDSF